jgi:uncharacterized RmlC-like cupin family protein
MPDARSVVIRADSGTPPVGPATPGMDRRQLFAADDRWVGWVRTDPGVEGGWHHHGEHDTYIYVISGTLHVDFGPGGCERVTARAGDVIFNPKFMVHREVTPPEEPCDLFGVRIGTGPQSVNVEGPDPG